MNYGGNMPDWHQYNASQTNEVTPATQNVNSGHLAFIPGVNHPTLNALSLSSEGLNKHQSDASFNPRNFQSFNNVSNGPNIPNNNPLASMVQMQNCIGHYGSTNARNPMLDNINASVDPRNAAVATINDEIGYRTNQVPFNGPIGHLSGPSCNLNASSGPIPGPGPGSGFGPQTNSGSNSGTNSGNVTGPGNMFGPGPKHGSVQGPGSGAGSGNLGPRNTNIGSVPSGKPGSNSFMPCKGACCNSDPNINYQQWEKFGPYQNNASYRDNVHPSGCQIENRHFTNNCNFRKDNLEGKEVMGPVLPNAPAIDHRRSYNDYKYHKDHLVHRNYSTSSGMFHNYPVQNYNYSTEHQKYTYPVKEHPKPNNMNIPNSGMLKHQEQNFMNQQKFNNKQFQYQNGNMLPKGVPTLNVTTNMASSPQNPYFGAQFSRNIPTEMNHECQETTDNAAMVNRMPSTFMHSSPQHQVYQHKIAMQKFSMENHLRELSRIPGYQSHPKYKECVLRYKEIVKLQQSTGYQNPVQQTSRVATPVNAAVPPINLQFDQNGMLINSNYNPDAFPKVHHAPAMKQPPDNIEKQSKDQAIAIANEKCQRVQQPEQLMVPPQSEHIPSSCVETFQKQSQFPVHKDFNQNQLKVQTSESHSFDTLKSNETAMVQQKVSKEFANKPELDVRQFLANWDETDDEDGTTSNLPNVALNETTPVVVVSYENVDLSPKTPQSTEASKRNSYCSNETELDKEGETNVIAAQDCLTISYSPTDSGPIAKKRTIREGVVKPGSIIHCISNGPDEIPTIHIVDNLEISNILGTSNEQVIQTLEKQKTISFFRETSGNETEAMDLEDDEQQDKNEADVLSTSYDGSLNVTKDTNIEDSNPAQATTVSISNQELRAKNNDLKKQNSFEESHNPDDISLPDLPTSECTPISTTLNTPIHSDTEESSQNLEDLSISTNPIEVMQNSPVISFTQLNSEEKSKSGSLATLDLEFQKQSRYKANEEVTLGNFDFSASNSKVKSVEIAKGKQVKGLGISTVRKKVFLIDGKEADTRVSDTCAALTSIEYELEVQQDPVQGEKSSESGSPGCTHEGKHKGARKSTDSVDNVRSVVSTGTNANLSPTESDEETQMSRRRRVKTSSVSTNTNSDTNAKKRAKETDLEDKDSNKHTERSSAQRQSKSLETRRFDDGDSAPEEHSVCHMTSQYKHYSVAVIKDSITLSDKSPEPQARTGNDTKELSEDLEIKKHAAGKLVPTSHESVQSSRKSELLQKDLKPVDGDVRYTAEEIRMLKEYRRKKERSKQHSLKTTEEESKKNEENSSHPRYKNNEPLATHGACLEHAVVNLSAKKLEEACTKSCCKSADFGIQVANVNLKIKDSDLAKELILGDKGQEQIKDSLEGIKIEINVSCKDQSSKSQEQNKRLYDDRDLYEIHEPPGYNALDCHCRLHAKEQDTVDASKAVDKAHNAAEKPVEDEVASSSTDISLKKLKSRMTSVGTNEDASCKDTPLDSVVDDTVKMKCAISNTAIVDANNKIKGKSKFEGGVREADSRNSETKVQKPGPVDASRQEEKEIAGASHSKCAKKLPDSSPEVTSRSLGPLDYSLDYKKFPNVGLELEDDYPGRWKKPKIDQILEDCDVFQSSSGYVNPIFSSIDKLEDLHTVPVYTTKDGKISYSPNRRFTYHELMMEARRREASCLPTRRSHYADTWNNYYSSKFRKLYKKKRHHPFNDRKKHEFKNTKYLYDRKRNYSDEFYGRKYKDYVHSIKNNNAVWTDHYKMDRMYSSSDSDEEIVNYNKRKIHTAESKALKSHTVDESDQEPKNKEDVDVCSNKDKDEGLKESVQSLDTGNDHCQDHSNKDNSNLAFTPIDQGKEDAESDQGDLPSEKSKSESKDPSSECVEPSTAEPKDSVISGNEEERFSTSELLNEVPTSAVVEEEQNKETTDLDKQEETVEDTKVDHETVDDTVDVEQAEVDKELQDKTESPEFETNTVNSLGFQLDSGEQVSQESLESKEPIDVLDKMVEESSENMEAKVDEEDYGIPEGNISERKEENIQLTEEIITMIKRQEECINKEMAEGSELSMEQNYCDPAKEAEDECSEGQEKSESQTDATIEQQNDLQYTFPETVQNQKDAIDVSEQMDNEESGLMDLSKYTIYIENDVAESLVETNTEEMEIALSDMKETLMEDHPKDQLNENSLEELRITSEQDLSMNSSEKEMPVLNKYCTDDPENKTEEDEEKQDPCNSPNADVKAIPKLIIKKSDALNPKSECLLNSMEADNSVDKYDAKLLPETRPKIPKMIIVKSRSRSATPTVELLEKTKSERTPEDNDSKVNADNSDSEQYTLKYNNYKSKVPKVKIKLEDISSKDLKLYLKRKASKKNVPKVKIKKLKTQDTKVHASVSKFETEDTSETDTDYEDHESALQEPVISDTESEKVPKLRLKRQDEESPERTREKDCASKVTPKKSRRTKEEDAKQSSAANDDELKKKFPQYIVEKIPKVIIKRTQIGAEFKCEISKGKKTSVAEASKWQPKVKLQRLQLLDRIVKDLKHSKITLKDVFSTPAPDTEPKDPIQGNKVKLSRSNSVSSLSPVKHKQRRLSDSGFAKADAKCTADFSDGSRNTNFKVDENRGPKKKSKRRPSPQSKQEPSENATKTMNSFRNFLISEDSDLTASKSEYSGFAGMEGARGKYLGSGVASSHNYDNNDNSIIKVESSDESQTTIEILPASPDSSESETDKNCEFENRLRIEDAIPTQLELELELMDNNMHANDHASHSRSACTNFGEFQRSETTFHRNAFEQNEQSSENTSSDYFYCNDLLVKEVLAAKEALKKCLARPENQDAENRKSRPMTVAEKKQGFSFNFKGFEEPCSKDTGDAGDKVRRKSKSSEKKDVEEAEERCSKQNKNLSVEKEADSQNEMVYSVQCPTPSSTCGHANVPESTTISLKASKRTNEADASELPDKHNDAKKEVHGEKSKKQGQKDGGSETKTKEDNMPLLVPEFALNFESSSDRDSSRSPPVITNQEEVESATDGEKTAENKLITPVEKMDSKEDSYKNCEMTIGDIITQLAYHEKATIKHKRYCNLCERWFPTTSRHTRHLAGYQHRYMELTQRKSIHALFILFTGKPCPRLLPANVIRNDCSIGELTPLQIAVQDVAKCVEYTQQNLKTKE